MVNKDLHLRQVADVLNVDIEQLRAINPQYRQDVINGYGEPAALRLPQDIVNAFIDNEDSIYVYQKETLLPKRATVVLDENVVASATRSSVARSGKASRSKRSKASRRSKTVTIRQGDTLSEIARRNNTTVAKLKRLNRISGTNIRAGKKIKVR